MPVLSTKLSYPRLPATLVVRERLLRDLDAALERRLTLLSASAGWGKTTLLTAWTGRQSARSDPVAWVSLDALDNAFSWFWVAVIAVLRALPALLALSYISCTVNSGDSPYRKLS